MGLKLVQNYLNFINNEVIPGTDISNLMNFGIILKKLFMNFAPINKNLIQKREDIQKKIDEWHKQNKGKELNKKEYINF